MVSNKGFKRNSLQWNGLGIPKGFCSGQAFSAVQTCLRELPDLDLSGLPPPLLPLELEKGTPGLDRFYTFAVTVSFGSFSTITPSSKKLQESTVLLGPGCQH